MTNQLLLHNGSWLLVDVKAPKIKVGDKAFNSLTNKIYEVIPVDLTEFEYDTHKLTFNNPILASETKLEGIPLLLKENVDEKLKEAREEKMNGKILPCPFCGKEPFEGCTGDSRYAIRCIPCGVVLVQDRADKVKSEWNKRLSSGKEYGKDDLLLAIFKARSEEWNTKSVEEIISSHTPQRDMEAEYQKAIPDHKSTTQFEPHILITKIILK